LKTEIKYKMIYMMENIMYIIDDKSKKFKTISRTQSLSCFT